MLRVWRGRQEAAFAEIGTAHFEAQAIGDQPSARPYFQLHAGIAPGAALASRIPVDAKLSAALASHNPRTDAIRSSRFEDLASIRIPGEMRLARPTGPYSDSGPAAALAENADAPMPPTAPTAPAPAAARADVRLLPVHGAPLPGGLIADTPTGETVEAPRSAGPRAFAVRIGRASLGGGMPAQSVVIADPGRFPVPGGLALLREAAGWRLLAIASGRDGGMIGYSLNPETERSLDDSDPAALAAVIAAIFV